MNNTNCCNDNNNNNFKVIINKNNLLHNVEYLSTLKNKKLISVVKANAYGHGIKEVVRILYSGGQREFAVARLREAEEILKDSCYPEIKILVFETISNFDMIKNNKNIYLSINSIEHLKNALAYGISPEQMHLKIDFGFGRNGILYEEQDELLKIIKDKNLNFEGVFSHLFAVTYNDGLTIIKNFTDFVNKLGKERFKMIHLQNTASILNYDIEIVTHIRPGLILYGLQEVGYFDPNLKQVFSLKGKIDEVKPANNNKYLGYRLKNAFPINDNMNIARIKIGYGDGFIRRNENSKCLINNKEYELKQITMDSTFLLVDEHIKAGDEVLLYFNMIYAATHLNMESLEILILTTDRLERVIE